MPCPALPPPPDRAPGRAPGRAPVMLTHGSTLRTRCPGCGTDNRMVTPIVAIEVGRVPAELESPHLVGHLDRCRHCGLWGDQVADLAAPAAEAQP